MKEFWNTIQLIFAAVGGWLGWFLGGCDGLLYALVLFVVLDYITGVMCAVVDKKLSSEVGFKGLFRKVLIFSLVGIGHAIDSQVIAHDQDFFMIEGEYQNEDGGSELVYCGVKRGQKKHFKRNKKEYKRLAEHIGLIPLIMVSPSDSLIIDGGGEERRRLIDMVVSQYDRAYITALLNYNKALQ